MNNKDGIMAQQH